MITHTQIIQVIIDPDNFFRELSTNAESSKLLPFLLVLFVGIINAINSVILLRNVSFEQTAPQISETVFGVVASIGVVTGLIGVFVMWLLYTIAFYIFSAFLGGSGSFRKLFWLVGWGYLPAIISSIVALFTTVYILGTMPTSVPAETAFEQYEAHPANTAAGVVGLLTLLWQGLIWSFVIQYVRDLPWIKAVTAAAIPLSVNLLIGINALL